MRGADASAEGEPKVVKRPLVVTSFLATKTPSMSEQDVRIFGLPDKEEFGGESILHFR